MKWPGEDFSLDPVNVMIQSLPNRKENCLYLKLLDDKVEIVPAVVGEQAGVEGEHDAGEVSLRVLEVEVLRLPPSELDQPCPDDDEEGEELGVGEHVLDGRGPLDVPAVDKCEDGYNELKVRCGTQ